METLLIHALEQGLAYGIAALGIFLTYRILDFPDLTVDGSFVTGAAIASLLLSQYGFDPFSVLVIAFVAGAAAGTVTGLLHTKLKITSLLSGVLMMIMLYSINLRIMGRPNLSLLRIGTVTRLVDAAWSGLGPVAILTFIAVLAIGVKLALDLFLRTEVGFALRATGDSEAMITAQGVNTNTMKVLGVAVANGLVALSGALVAQYNGFADVGMGTGTIVTGLAAVIIGATLIRSSRIGWMTAGVLVGSIIYRMAVVLALRYGYVIGFQASDMKLVTSLLVILALVAPTLRERRQRKVRAC